MTTSTQGDRVVRAISDDGAFRVITAKTTDTVRASARAQKTSGDAMSCFANLLTGSILLRETLAPDLRVQAILESADKKSRMVADAHPEGMTRGLVQGDATTFSLSSEAVLQVARTLHNGSIHQGVVAAPAEGGISKALMSYMQASEQIVSVIAVGTHIEGGEIRSAGGYIVQLLPEVGEGPLMVMTERLNEFERIEGLLESGAAEPEQLLSELLYGMPYTNVGEADVRFGCHCSSTRVLASLSSLPRQEIQEFLDAGEVLEIACDYCGEEYKIGPEQLRGLVKSN